MTIIQRKRFQFYGDVQGVGFRWRAYHNAQDLGLSGWVRNEYDGSVTMEVQGEREKIQRLIQILQNQRWIDIRFYDEKELPVDPHMEESFRIAD